jgi:hypothetical protein
MSAALLFVLAGGWRYDDPFITYRYAAQLAAGNGFVYNPGERTQSTSSPLLTLLLAIARLTGADLAAAAVWIGCLSLAVCALLLFVLLRGWGVTGAGVAAALITPVYMPLVATLGGEMPLLLALSLAAIAAARVARFGASGLLCGLAFLARGDGLIAFAVVCVMLMLSEQGARRRKLLRLCAGFAVLAGPWLVFSAAYFGSPLPATLAVKRAQGLLAISDRYLEGFPVVVGWYASQPVNALEALLAGIGLMSVVAARERRVLWPLLAFGVLHALGYVALGVSGYFWYYAPLFLTVVCAAAAGAERVWQVIRARSLPVAQMLAVLVLGAGVGTHARQVQTQAAAPNARHEQYQAARAWLRENARPDEAVGLLEAGIIGYDLPNRGVDFAGLLQPELLSGAVPANTYDDFARRAIQRERPVWLALPDAALPGTQTIAEDRCIREKGFVARDAQPALIIYRCPEPGAGF